MTVLIKLVQSLCCQWEKLKLIATNILGPFLYDCNLYLTQSNHNGCSSGLRRALATATNAELKTQDFHTDALDDVILNCVLIPDW